MRMYFYTAVGLLMVFNLSSTPVAAADKPIEMTAEKLGQEDLDKGESALDDKYKGKIMRISGKVESVAENYVYVGTGLKHKQGQPVQIVMIFPKKADAQKLKAGTKAVIEGRYELAGVLGPSFKQCRLVKKQ